MGQLMTLALGDFSMVQAADMPWAPLADLRENDDAYVTAPKSEAAKPRHIEVKA